MKNNELITYIVLPEDKIDSRRILEMVDEGRLNEIFTECIYFIGKGAQYILIDTKKNSANQVIGNPYEMIDDYYNLEKAYKELKSRFNQINRLGGYYIQQINYRNTEINQLREELKKVKKANQKLMNIIYSRNIKDISPSDNLIDQQYYRQYHINNRKAERNIDGLQIGNEEIIKELLYRIEELNNRKKLGINLEKHTIVANKERIQRLRERYKNTNWGIYTILNILSVSDTAKLPKERQAGRRAVDDKVVQKIIELDKMKISQARIAKQLGLGQSTVRKYIQLNKHK